MCSGSICVSASSRTSHATFCGLLLIAGPPLLPTGPHSCCASPPSPRSISDQRCGSNRMAHRARRKYRRLPSRSPHRKRLEFEFQPPAESVLPEAPPIKAGEPPPIPLAKGAGPIADFAEVAGSATVMIPCQGGDRLAPLSAPSLHRIIGSSKPSRQNPAQHVCLAGASARRIGDRAFGNSNPTGWIHRG